LTEWLLASQEGLCFTEFNCLPPALN